MGIHPHGRFTALALVYNPRETNPTMTTILLIAGAFILTAAVVLLYCVLSAPDGHEDAEGFHVDVQDDSFWDQREMVEPGRESHSLNV